MFADHWLTDIVAGPPVKGSVPNWKADTGILVCAQLGLVLRHYRTLEERTDEVLAIRWKALVVG
jgi:hypothetical protein